MKARRFFVEELMCKDYNSEIQWRYTHPERYKTRDEALEEVLSKMYELRNLGHYIKSVDIDLLKEAFWIFTDESSNTEYYVFEC